MSRIAILGAGMAGLGAARRLRAAGVEATVFERERRAGGHTRSFRFDDGFVFDDGPHISFTRDERIQKLLAEAVGGEYEVVQAQVNNHWRGHWIKHPAQVNLHGLPEDLVVRVIEDFVAAGRDGGRSAGGGAGGSGETPKGEPAGAPPSEPARSGAEPAQYEEWLIAAYGRTFAETFPMEYGEKYHTCPARQMSTDWLGPRLYRPKLSEVLRGALSPATPDVHYVDHFRYPSRGGFESYVEGLASGLGIESGREVVAIDPGSGGLRFASGETVAFDRLISSLPLPVLVAAIAAGAPERVPEEVTAAAARLACTTCVVVNLGVDRASLSEAHWTYFYDRDFTITRVSFPHMLSPANAPPGCGSFQCEIYFSEKYRPLPDAIRAAPEALVEPAIADLKRCGLLSEGDRILHRDARLVPFANVIFDLDRAPALATVDGYLDELGIERCGRYGEWGYHWTDESFASGERAAERVLEK